MFNAVSMTGVGAVITVVETVLRMTGIDFPDGSVAAAVNGIIAFIGLLWLIWGQLRRGDLIAGLVRKYRG